MTVDLARHEDLKRRLKAAGSSLADIARHLKRSPSTVTVVSQGYRVSHKVQTEIATVLGTTPDFLFPERYQTEPKECANKSRR